jgi:5-methylcytosine-specific restriction endonuclease McrA
MWSGPTMSVRKRYFSRKERRYLGILAGFRCEDCGTVLFSNLHGDHWQPFSRGGLTSLSNGRALCPACNLKKGDRCYENRAKTSS